MNEKMSRTESFGKVFNAQLEYRETRQRILGEVVRLLEGMRKRVKCNCVGCEVVGHNQALDQVTEKLNQLIKKE